MPPYDLHLVLSVGIATLLMGWISWPVTRFFLNGTSDRGYGMAKVLGWMVTGYAAFLGASFRLIPLEPSTLAGWVFLWALLNFRVWLRCRHAWREGPGVGRIFRIETAFWGFLFFWAVLKAHRPEIHGMERLMDFGILRSLFETRWLPVTDFWFLGKPLNYYYFGHFIFYFLLTFSGLTAAQGFYLMTGWTAGLVALGVYRLGRDVTADFAGERSVKGFFAPARIAGVTSSLTVLFAGPWFFARFLVQKIQAVFLGGPQPGFWYPEGTRGIPHTNTEMPLYSFLVSDLHPYVTGLLSGVLVITFLYAFWKAEEPVHAHGTLLGHRKVFSWKRRDLWMLAWLLGIANMVHSWDAIPLGFLAAACLVFKHARSHDRLRWTAAVMVMAAAALLVSLPWSFFLRSPFDGLGWVQDRSPLLAWTAFWGGMVLPLVLYLFSRLASRLSGRTISVSAREGFGFLGVLLTGVIFCFVFMETVYFKDLYRDSAYCRFNTVFKLSTQTWLYLGITAGPLWIATLVLLRTALLRAGIILVFIINLTIQMVYPIMAIPQFFYNDPSGKSLQEGLDWWRKAAPADFEAYLFLQKIQNGLPPGESRNLLETNSPGYSDHTLFSTFLGWPTVLGWEIHQWSWRGGNEGIRHRRDEIREVYTGQDLGEAKKILTGYGVDYLILGASERELFADALNEEKIRGLGKIVFEKGETRVLAVSRRARGDAE